MQKTNKEILSDNLTYYMAIKGVDRNTLCEALGLKYSTVSEWLSAKKYPRIDKIEILADYFDIEKSDLIEDKRANRKNIELRAVDAIPDDTPSASDDELKFALFDGSEGVTDEMFEEVKQFAAMVKMREDAKKEKK